MSPVLELLNKLKLIKVDRNHVSYHSETHSVVWLVFLNEGEAISRRHFILFIYY